MAHVTRHIGLSLGADICWPICFEAILRRLELAIPAGADTLGFDVSHVTIEPFDLRHPVRYDLVIDRLTHWYYTSREWIKKAMVLNDTYVFNNPWSIQADEKHTWLASNSNVARSASEAGPYEMVIFRVATWGRLRVKEATWLSPNSSNSAIVT